MDSSTSQKCPVCHSKPRDPQCVTCGALPIVINSTLTGADRAWRGVVAGLGIGLALASLAFAGYFYIIGDGDLAGKCALASVPIGVYGGWALWDWTRLWLVVGLALGIAGAVIFVASGPVLLALTPVLILLTTLAWGAKNRGTIFKAGTSVKKKPV
ncbi:hypothetical protein ITJ38_17570 [Agreia pratensis]|uniref:hypothetical protein n=1 Tax=Agreia pratensis TaxID=150121 RepID=UPI00188B37D6|nr:hypothetical protein [Agreia pratensis]MBF4636223.1 hypothetical protein [Agreia pratensis]